MYIIVVISMINCLEQSLHLSKGPPMKRKQEHYSHCGTISVLSQGNSLKIPSGVPYTALPPDIHVVEQPCFLHASNVVEQILTLLGRSTRNGRKSIFLVFNITTLVLWWYREEVDTPIVCFSGR